MKTPARGSSKATRRMQQLGIRWHVSLVKKIDDWCATQEDEPTRAEGVRRLVKLGLEVDQHAQDRH